MLGQDYKCVLLPIMPCESRSCFMMGMDKNKIARLIFMYHLLEMLFIFSDKESTSASTAAVGLHLGVKIKTIQGQNVMAK